MAAVRDEGVACAGRSKPTSFARKRRGGWHDGDVGGEVSRRAAVALEDDGLHFTAWSRGRLDDRIPAGIDGSAGEEREASTGAHWRSETIARTRHPVHGVPEPRKSVTGSYPAQLAH
jgi:hypothetical protein